MRLAMVADCPGRKRYSRSVTARMGGGGEMGRGVMARERVERRGAGVGSGPRTSGVRGRGPQPPPQRNTHMWRARL